MNRRGGSIFQNPCQYRCPDGGDCCLNPAVPHNLHICNEPECPCHSQARYQESQQPNPSRRLPSGIRAFELPQAFVDG